MSTLTPLAVAALALLAERPMHPYEMLQTLSDRHTDLLVKVRPGSLYHTVERLVRDDLAVPIGVERCGARPERTTYQITDAGRDSLTAQVSAMLVAPVNEFPRLPLALSEAHNLPRSTVSTLLRERLTHLDETIASLRLGIEQVEARNLPARLWIDLDYRTTTYDTERRWIAELVTRLDSGDLEW